MNLGLFQRDVNVIWDLAVHDFAIMDYLLDATPVAVSASAAGFLPNRPESMAHLSVHFDNGSLAHLKRELAFAGEAAPDPDRGQPPDGDL